MTSAQLREIRKRLGLTAEVFGRALGYEGEAASIKVTVYRLENMTAPVPGPTAVLAMLYDLHPALLHDAPK